MWFLDGSYLLFSFHCVVCFKQNIDIILYIFCTLDFDNRSCGPYSTSVALSYWVISNGNNNFHALVAFSYVSASVFFMKLQNFSRFKEKFESLILRGNEKNASDREKHIGSTVAKVMIPLSSNILCYLIWCNLCLGVKV